MLILVESITFFVCGELAAGEHICSICYSQSTSQTSGVLFLLKENTVSDEART